MDDDSSQEKLGTVASRVASKFARLEEVRWLDARWAQDQHARFRLWCSASGAFARKQASLDHILRLHEAARLVFLNFLDDLDANIQFLLNTTEPSEDFGDSRENIETGFTQDDSVSRNAIESQDSQQQQDSEDRLATSCRLLDQKNESDSLSGSVYAEDLGKYAQERVEEDLGMLISYMAVINKQTKKAIEDKADGYNPQGPLDPWDPEFLGDDITVSLIPQFSQYVHAALQRAIGPSNWSLLQEEGSALPDRLVQTVVRRWRRLCYRIDRTKRKKLLTRDNVEAPSPFHPLPTRSTTLRDSNRSPSVQNLRANITQPCQSPLSMSAGSTLQPSAANPSNVPQPARTATVAAATSTEYPRCPEMRRVNGGVEFHCNYCSTLIKIAGIETNEAKVWASHLMTDLMPYVCTYEQCQQPYELYPSLEEWKRHLDVEHMAYVWTCPLCSSDSPHAVFASSEGLLAHVSSKHETPVIPDLCKRPSSREKCELCESKDILEGSRQAGYAISSPEVQQKLLTCTAQHLKEYALMSLPWHLVEKNTVGSDQADVDENESINLAPEQLEIDGPPSYHVTESGEQATLQLIKAMTSLQQTFDPVLAWIDETSEVAKRAETIDALVQHETVNRHLVIGIDYGTSYSGVAYALFDDKDSVAVGEVEISVIKDLDQSNAGGGPSDKVPSDTAYDEFGDLVGQGFEIPEGVQPLQWVKLLLEPNGFKDKTANDVEMWKCYKDLREKKPVDVVTDYLRWLWERTKDCVIDKVDEDDIFENKDVHLTVVLTVPASWSERAKQCVQKAAAMAGIPELAIKLVPEPEAAAIFGLKSQAQKKTIEKGDCVIVCDAGGGTVDLVAYRVLRRHPLQIDQITASDGSFCGSAFIDTEFKNQLKSILGAKYDQLDDAAKAAIEHEFEFKIKRTYNPDQLPQKRHFIPMPLEDDPGRHIENGKMRIDEAVLITAFESIMTPIMTLIDKQVEELVSKDYGDRIKGTLLVGGLSKSEYLRNRLKQEYPDKDDMKIWRADDPWTAVAKGAVACETSKVGHARLSPYSFGIPYLDQGEKKVHWLVRKGQPVKSYMPTQPYALRIDDEPWLDQDEYCHILVNLVRSGEDDTEDGYRPRVVPHAEIDCRVPTKLLHSKDARLIQKKGKKAWHIPATLVLYLDGAVI